MKYFVLLFLFLGVIAILQNPVHAVESTVFVIDGFPITVDSKIVSHISLNWSPVNDLPGGTLTLSDLHDGTIEMMIPKNMPRTTNLDFGHFSLFALQTNGSEYPIKETESWCFYTFQIPVYDSDSVEIFGASVAAGRWEPVKMENEECDVLYDHVFSLQDISLSTFHENQLWKSMPPLKQFKLGVPIPEMHCNDGLELAKKKSNGNIVCIKSSSIEKLFERDYISDLVRIGLPHALPDMERK